ncbi:ATP-binding protein [Caldinitratiruptor microaerophilus]|uniref:Ferredoxin n=1 Tax=Caldinitratiruptor microaerophilus TaxID=671077 RepID=A0AA35CKV3_9FIRM|nr:4Fe-4S binding protein [Caldinitratiruptor microaerophilus]BDG61067.1 hypothetical protein caldi_21570 [Caldinitratiruptor microaerophilus]
MVGLVARFLAPAAAADPERCLRAGPAGEGCDACSGACPAGAIAVAAEAGPGAPPRVDPDRCRGCGACVPACPAGAISLPGAGPGELLGSLQAAGTESIACAAAPADAVPPGAVRLPCLAALHPETAVAVAVHPDGPGTLALHAGDCGTCPVGAGARAREVVEEVRARLSRLDLPAASSPRRPAPLSRRDLLARWARGAAQAAAALLPPQAGVASGGSPASAPAVRSARQPPPWRRALLAALEAAGRPVVPHVADSGLPLLAPPDRCTFCGVCAAACPTGALVVRTGQAIRLEVDEGACTGCGLCAMRCPEGVMAVACDLRPPAAGRTPARRELARGAAAACRRCGRPLWPGEGALCRACETRAELLAAIAGGGNDGTPPPPGPSFF